jgi:hypothetical protein
MEIINLLDPSIVVAVSKAATCTTDTGSSQCIVPGTLKALDGLKQVIMVLVTADEKSGPGSLFSIVLQPCKVFVGLGIMWSLDPLLNSSINTIKQ